MYPFSSVQLHKLLILYDIYFFICILSYIWFHVIPLCCYTSFYLSYKIYLNSQFLYWYRYSNMNFCYYFFSANTSYFPVLSEENWSRDIWYLQPIHLSWKISSKYIWTFSRSCWKIISYFYYYIKNIFQNWFIHLYIIFIHLQSGSAIKSIDAWCKYKMIE